MTTSDEEFKDVRKVYTWTKIPGSEDTIREAFLLIDQTEQFADQRTEGGASKLLILPAIVPV
jgi:hypothetical protein